MKSSQLFTSLFFYSFTHLVVDAACIALILGGIDVRSELLSFIVFYNVLAFGLQLPFGWVTDKMQKPAFIAFMGCVILAAGILMYRYAIIAIALAGIGNALFHVGGGTVSLNYKPHKAALPGLFVATGGIGLFLGGLWVKMQIFYPIIFVVLLMGMGITLAFLKTPAIDYKIQKVAKQKTIYLVLILLFVIIGIRSVVGLALSFPWKSNLNFAVLLALSLALGKGLGGILADYFGWIKISVGGLLISALLLFYGGQYAFAGIIGVFLFNFTMPVTLVATSNLLPGRPGFAFGLTTLALLFGALPTFFPAKSLFSTNWVGSVLVVLSSIVLWFALKLYGQLKN